MASACPRGRGARRVRSGPAAAIAALLVLTIVAYHNCFRGDFIYDDLPSIVGNRSIRQLWPLPAAMTPPPQSGTAGRPIANLTFAANYALGELNVTGYRAGNLLIHLLATLALFGVVRRTLLLPGLAARFGNVSLALATAIAAVWGVHPVLSVVVNYVSQRTESLMALCYLFTLYAFIRGLERDTRGWQVVAVVACVVGMACKEVMVTAPLALLLYDRGFVAGSLRQAWRERWPVYVGAAASWGLLGVLMDDVQQRSVGYSQGITWWEYALTQSRALTEYLHLALWPFPLIFDRGMSVDRSVAAAAPFLLPVLGLLAVALWALWRWKRIGFVAFWFFLVLAPTSGVVPIVRQPIAENRLYLPLAGVVTLVVLAAHAAAPRRAPWLCPLVCLGLALLTIERNRDFRNAIAIWTDTVAKAPLNARAHNNLGTALGDAGRAAEALESYRRAVALEPDYADAHSNIADAYIQLRQFDEAIAEARRALSLDPDLAGAHNNLGYALVRTGNVAEAIEHYRAALRTRPDASEIRNNLASALYRSGLIAEAAEQYRVILERDPKFVVARRNLEQLERLLQAGAR